MALQWVGLALALSVGITTVIEGFQLHWEIMIIVFIVFIVSVLALIQGGRRCD